MQKFRIFPRHFVHNSDCKCTNISEKYFPDISCEVHVRCGLCSYHKYFGEIPDIFCLANIYFKRPGNLIRNIGYFPGISNEVRCACVCGYHKYFGKIPDIFACFPELVLTASLRMHKKYLEEITKF